MNDDVMVSVTELSKTFILHQQGGARLPALKTVSLEITAGECLALHGPSGAGKSTLLRCLYGNYRPSEGRIRLRHRGAPVDLTAADPREILEIRRHTLGYVSQFLRVIPRVPALDIVAEPLFTAGTEPQEARLRAGELLARLNIPKRLWPLAPATFSGGEQQRVNIARGFIRPAPILLLDEPTASLDAANRRVVESLIREAKGRGAAVAGIFHDDETRRRVADREFPLARPNGNGA